MSSPTCTCGHAIEEHGHDPKFPGSTACTADGCDCIAFEADEECSCSPWSRIEQRDLDTVHQLWLAERIRPYPYGETF